MSPLSFPLEDSVCFTGHRQLPTAILPALQNLTEQTVYALYEQQGVRHFWAGGALGFDMLASIVVVNARFRCPEIQLHLALPCQAHTKHWTEPQRQQLARVSSLAAEVVYVSQDYFPGCMAVRNRFLVDHASRCISYLTDLKGGTAFTVRYAQKKGCPVLNLAELL